MKHTYTYDISYEHRYICYVTSYDKFVVFPSTEYHCQVKNEVQDKLKNPNSCLQQQRCKDKISESRLGIRQLNVSKLHISSYGK